MLGKFAAIIGPFLVGFVTLITKSNRIGILSLILLFAVGGVLLYKVDESKAEKEIGTATLSPDGKTLTYAAQSGS